MRRTKNVSHQKQMIKIKYMEHVFRNRNRTNFENRFQQQKHRKKDQIYGACLLDTETGPVLKTVFGNRIQRENKYQIYGACLSEAFSNTNVVGTRIDTLDTQKGGKMRYLKKASMTRNSNYSDRSL